MKRLHVVPEINEANGVFRVAQMLAREDGGEFIDCSDCSIVRLRTGEYDEVWVHGMWLPKEWRACWIVRLFGLFRLSGFKRATRPKLVRMTHGSLSPVYLERQGKWKKRLVGPIERWLFSKTDRVVVTCAAEKAWCERWGLENEFEVVDLKRLFKLSGEGEEAHGVHSAQAVRTPLSCWERPLRVLYLGRRHPLKGVEFLEQAVAELNKEIPLSTSTSSLHLRIVSNHFGEELERDWEWCDVLCLPTLSENFGLVVAEALERGKRVVVTDGAPTWEPPPKDEVEKVGGGGQWWDRLFYVRGYRDGTDEERVKLLKGAFVDIICK